MLSCLRYVLFGMTPNEWWEIRQHHLYWGMSYLRLLKFIGREESLCLPELEIYLDMQNKLKLFADKQDQKIRMRKKWWDEEFEGWEKNVQKET